MPLYEYACSGCKSQIEVKQSFADAPLTTHDGCGGQLRRVLRPVGIVFKGSGWYITDSRPTPSESS
jgi:putative FmdB family regulatory protein